MTPSLEHRVSLPTPNSTAAARGPRTLADLTVDYLERLGVEYVFGVPGGHIAALYEALDRSERRGGPRAILARHETGAAYMADGYARETGRLGVCCATTGPGVTNLITGVASAYCDHTPMLVITAQTLLPHFGAGAFQESSPDGIDAAGMLARCTRYNSIVTHPGQFEHKLAAALHHALRGPRGPVHLSVPVDVYRAPAAAGLAHPHLPALLAAAEGGFDAPALERLWQDLAATLREGRRVVVLAGHACDGAGPALLRFAEATGAAVLATHRGKRWVDPYHPLALGVFGYAGHESARRALAEPEPGLILAAGTALGQWTTSNWDAALLNERLVHIHPDPGYFDRSPMARLHLRGTVEAVFEALAARALALPDFVPPAPPPRGSHSGVPAQVEVRAPEDYRSAAAPLHPQRLVMELMRGLPPETRFLVDTSCWLPWTLHYFFSSRPENYRLSSELAAMGWAIGAAVGTALAAPGAPVVALTGDGCYLMFGQEVAVAVAERLPVLFIVLNDSGYGMVKHRHRQITDQPLEFALSPVDFSLMAQAVGAHGVVVRAPEDWAKLDLPALFRRDGPTVLDVRVDPEAAPPTGMF